MSDQADETYAGDTAAEVVTEDDLLSDDEDAEGLDDDSDDLLGDTSTED